MIMDNDDHLLVRAVQQQTPSKAETKAKTSKQTDEILYGRAINNLLETLGQ